MRLKIRKIIPVQNENTLPFIAVLYMLFSIHYCMPKSLTVYPIQTGNTLPCGKLCRTCRFPYPAEKSLLKGAFSRVDLTRVPIFERGLLFVRKLFDRECALLCSLFASWRIAWTSDVTLSRLVNNARPASKPACIFTFDLHSFHIEIRSQILLQTWQQCTVWASMESSCHCGARLSNIIVSNGITGSK